MSSVPPILQDKHYGLPSALTPEALLREARRKKTLPQVSVPELCVFDPNGNIVRQLTVDGRAERHGGWACYHTSLYRVRDVDPELGFVGSAVGAPFAVLVAEQLFASGCKILFSVSSAGQIVASSPSPYFVLIDRALRDEGTSLHYTPPTEFSEAPLALIEALRGAFCNLATPVLQGATWTTDAPYRETEPAICAMRERELLAVEMEAAALYAFARAHQRPVVCFAKVTNQMGRIAGDFEKGAADGAYDALAVIEIAARRLIATLSSEKTSSL